MMRSKILLLMLCLSCYSILLTGKDADKLLVPEQPLKSLQASHPRLLVSSLETFKSLKTEIDRDDFLSAGVRTLTTKANAMLQSPNNKYTLKPTRYLLNVSRSVLDRSYTLSMMFRLTGDRKYVDRLWRELENAAAFPDWDPKHFLGTAEMTHAFAIAYDWLYDQWTPQQRGVIKNAIIEKGLKAGNMYYNQTIKGGNVNWPRVSHNWNLVGNGAMIIGALAVADDEHKAFCEAIITQAITSVQRSLKGFAPDGAWPEGPTYMKFATRYNVAMLASLQSALQNDFGLSDLAGVSRSGLFLVAMSGSTGYSFNYGDGNANITQIPELFWLANRFNQPSVALHQQTWSDHNSATELLWYKKYSNSSTIANNNYFRGTEVATLRSGWNKDDWFVGFKAGANNVNHGHLDIGNFILERSGERWGVDLGSDDYKLPGYFKGKGTNATRWEYYRTATEGHNTLTFSGKNQPVEAKTTIEKFNADVKNSFGIMDMTEAYKDNVVAAKRGIALNKNGVLIQDEIELKGRADFDWQFHTPAVVSLSKDRRTATLQIGQKRIDAEILSPSDAVFNVVGSKELKRSSSAKEESENKGITKLTMHFSASGSMTIAVAFKDADIEAKPQITKMNNW